MRILNLIIVLSVSCCSVFAQSNPLLEKYRSMALSYNTDLKAAEKNISVGKEMVKSAKYDARPRLDGNGIFRYTGNPTELTVHMPSATSPITFRGQEMNYGLSVAVLQPLYTGGRVVESIRLAQHNQSFATNSYRMVRSDVCFQTDLQYWNTVASNELTSLYSSFYKSTQNLMTRVKERVDVGVSDVQDLLMVEVKLNDAHYQLLRSLNTFQTNCMTFNSLLGNELNMKIDIDSTLLSYTDSCYISSVIYNDRAELRMANDNIFIQESSLIINDSKYKPQLYFGAEGSYSSPGFNFRRDIDPNYAFYAKLSVPIFDWGRRRSDKRANKYKVGIAQDNLNRIIDEVELQVQSAKINLMQSTERVKLTESSLEKAEENESKAVERYIEGNSSIVELLDARFYKLTAKINFVQAKLAMHINYSELLKAANAYCLK